MSVVFKVILQVDSRMCFTAQARLVYRVDQKTDFL